MLGFHRTTYVTPDRGACRAVWFQIGRHVIYFRERSI